MLSAADAKFAERTEPSAREDEIPLGEIPLPRSDDPPIGELPDVELEEAGAAGHDAGQDAGSETAAAQARRDRRRTSKPPHHPRTRPKMRQPRCARRPRRPARASCPARGCRSCRLRRRRWWTGRRMPSAVICRCGWSPRYPSGSRAARCARRWPPRVSCSASSRSSTSPTKTRRAVLSAASLTRPGTFDVDTMDSQHYGGLSLFAVLPGPRSRREAFDELVSTARSLNERLQGVLQDEQGSPLTPARIASAARASRARDLLVTAAAAAVTAAAGGARRAAARASWRSTTTATTCSTTRSLRTPNTTG